MANERRLIDANALPVTTLTDGGYWTKDVVYKSDVDAAPTVDAIIPVRCKDCKHYRKYMGRSMCARNAKLLDGHEVHLTATSDDRYCSDGERMSGTQPQREDV